MTDIKTVSNYKSEKRPDIISLDIEIRPIFELSIKPVIWEEGKNNYNMTAVLTLAII